MTLYILFILGGIVLAVIGGELFVRGSVGLARSFRVPVGLIGVTVAAFATSSPEISVAVNAALAGEPKISLGDLLGSNIVNVALILAIALLFSGIRVSVQDVKRDFVMSLGVPILLGLLSLDGELSRLDGVWMIAAFAVWLTLTIREALRHRQNSNGSAEERPFRAIIFCVIGLAILILSGRLIVDGAKGVASALGASEFVIGATVVAISTSTPELATTIMAKIRGHDELGLGNVLGSNIFNGAFIAALLMFISPMTISIREIGVELFFGVLVVLAIIPLSEWIGRKRGFFLLATYVAYLIVVIGRQ
jgi:cation:H+ antiporter